MEKKYRKLLTNFKFHATSEILTKNFQFEQWIRKMFYLNSELRKEYNLFYQELFWVTIYQFLTEGEYYLRDIKSVVDKGTNYHKKKWYGRLLEGMIEIKSQFKQNDFEYLQYRRHNVCHIFQQDYSVFNKDNSLKTMKGQTRKNKSIINIEIMFFSILDEYGNDEGFDKHYRSSLFTIIDKLYNDLQDIQQIDK